MNRGHWRQPQIIRLLARATLAGLVLWPTCVSAQDRPTACVSCLVIAVNGSDLGALANVPAGRLDGVQLIIPGTGPFEQTRASGADISVIVPPASGSPSQVVFAARTAITLLRAEHPGTQIVIDPPPLRLSASPSRS